MTEREMVYRGNAEWRSAYGGTLACAKPGDDVCPDGFARQLVYGTSGVVYRDVGRVRANAASQFTPPGARHESKHAPRQRDDRNKTDRKCARWTQERIDALPRKSGWLTRIGDTLDTGNKHKPFVPCECSGSSPRCRKKILVEACVFARDGRPQSCRPCAHERKRSASAFTENGYAHARDFAAKQRENETDTTGVAA